VAYKAEKLTDAVGIEITGIDLREADTEVRVLVTGVLGAVLLAVAWGYARSRRSHDGEP